MGVVTLALLVTAVALVATLQRSVRSEALTAATTRAQDVASQLVADGGLTEHLGLEPAPGEAVVIQLLLDGVVVGASPAMEGRPPLTALAPAPGQTLTTSVALPSGDGDDDGSVAAVLGVDLPDVDTVVVALSLEAGEGTVGRLVALLALVCPLLVAVVGVVTYVLTGRALAPVEDIRRRTASISAADLSVRVPVPDTGDEVASLAVTMNQMLDRLDDAHHAQRRFVSDASHELRSPLATLRTEIEVALRDPGDWERTAQGLLAESVRMQTLVDDLLTLAKADERGVPVRLVEVDLDDLADAEVRRLRTSGRTVAAHVEPVRVMGDRDQLARVLRNLTENADRHAVARVAVRVRTAADGSALVEVGDDGPGIPPADRRRVFDRFVRLDASRARSAGGSGLGLAIVAEIVAAHGGSASVRVDPDLGGALLVVSLPCDLPGEPPRR